MTASASSIPHRDEALAEALGCDDLAEGKSRRVLCPAHGDETPSLNVTRAKDKFLFTCHAGCSYEEILAACDVAHAPGKPVSITRTKTGELGPKVKTADYATEKKLRIELLRELGMGPYVEFKFRDAVKLRHREGFSWSHGKAREFPLWPEPEDDMPSVAYLCEGETDCLTLRQVGLAAYSITGGAATSFTVAHYRALMARGLEHIIICGDGDESGQKWLREETNTALASGLRVSTVELAPFYDPFGSGQKDINELWLTCESDDPEAEFLELLQSLLVEFQVKRPLQLAEVRVRATEEIEWLVKDLLSPKEKGLLHGLEKSYKTWVALDLAKAVATGGRFLGYEGWSVVAPRPVLLVEEEGHAVKFAQRIDSVFRGLDDAPLHLWHRHGFRLTDTAMVDALIKYIEEHQIALAILDPFQRMKPDVDENAVKEMSLVWDAINRITNQTDAAVLVVHHDNKDGGYRGSSITGGEPDFLLHVTCPGRGELRLDLIGRDVILPEGAMAIHFDDPAHLSYSGFKVTINKGDASYRKVAELLDEEWRGAAYFEDGSELGRKAVREHLNSAVERGDAETKREGEYRTAPQFWRRTK